MENLQQTIGEGPWLTAFHDRGPVLRPDLAQAASRWSGFTPAASRAGIAAFFAFPSRSAPSGLVFSTCTATSPGRLHPQVADAADGHREIHQATGIITVLATVSINDALLLLRARAYADDRPLLEPAQDVVARRVTFHREDDHHEWNDKLKMAQPAPEGEDSMSREQRLAQVFVELANTLVDDFDVLELLHTLCDRSVELLQADAAGLILADHRSVLHVVASTTDEARLLELFVLQNAECPCLDCYSTGERMVNVDLDEVVERWPRFHAATIAAGYRSTHALPLRLRGQVLGVINLFCVDRATLSDDDVNLGQALCDIATVGLLQERAQRQSAILAEQLQSALNSRVLLEQAKGALSERAGISVDEAFTLMRNHARRNQQQLVTVATAVIEDTISVATLRGTDSSAAISLT